MYSAIFAETAKDSLLNKEGQMGHMISVLLLIYCVHGIWTAAREPSVEHVFVLLGEALIALAMVSAYL